FNPAPLNNLGEVECTNRCSPGVPKPCFRPILSHSHTFSPAGRNCRAGWPMLALSPPKSSQTTLPTSLERCCRGQEFSDGSQNGAPGQSESPCGRTPQRESSGGGGTPAGGGGGGGGGGG